MTMQLFEAAPATSNYPADPQELESKLTTPRLKNLLNQVMEGKRVSKEDALYLYELEDPEPLRLLADLRRQLIAKDLVYYTTNLYIHPTNLCVLSCPMCSFYAKPGWKSAWFMTPEDIEKKVRENLDKGIQEIHIVGGMWEKANLDYYQEVFTRIKQIDPKLYIKAMTPVEYHYLAELHGLTVKEVLRRMKSWGLGSLTGGGAEILVDSIRKQVAPQKITTDEFLEIHEIAHQLEIRSNITMLYGHVEDPVHIIEHCDRVRLLQDKTAGFKAFIPLKYHVENNALGKRTKRLKPKDPYRVYAVSRLMLDNVRNIKVLWNYLGIEQAQELLRWGGNDFASTAIDEKIIKMAGGVEIDMRQEGMEKVIQEAGRVPKQIHTGYDYSLDQ